jgi:hypothetical protein
MNSLPDTTAPGAHLNTGPRPCSRRHLLRWCVGLAAVLPMARHAASAATQAPASQLLFDGTSLGPWKPVVFGGEGEVRLENGHIVLDRGNDLTGVVWTGAPLPAHFTVELEAMRVDGTDFFCGLTFPVAGRHCTFVVGGWGGSLIGLSNLEGYDASENETSQVRRLVDRRWYRIRVRVSPTSMQAMLDDELLADVALEGRDIDVRPEMEPCRPLGIASYRTVAAIRAIRLTPAASVA